SRFLTDWLQLTHMSWTDRFRKKDPRAEFVEAALDTFRRSGRVERIEPVAGNDLAFSITLKGDSEPADVYLGNLWNQIDGVPGIDVRGSGEAFARSILETNVTPAGWSDAAPNVLPAIRNVSS